MKKIFKDYNKIDLATARGKKEFLGAIQAYWNGMGKAIEYKGKTGEFVKGVVDGGTSYSTHGENFSVTADILNVIERYHSDIYDIDNFYENAFDIVDLTNSNVSSMTIRDVASGLTFSKVKDGMKAKVYSVMGDEVTCTLDLWGGGLDWQKKWFMDGEWWSIEENAIEFNRKWFEDKATNFYTLIQAISDSAHDSMGAGTYTSGTTVSPNISYDLLGTGVVDKDRNTINDGARSLIEDLADGGMGVSASTKMVMLCPLKWKARIQNAFNMQYGRVGTTDEGAINYNITPYFSHHITTASTWADEGTGGSVGTCTSNVPLGYLCVPGKKNKIGNRMNLTVLSEDNILSFSTTVVGWGRYGAYINEGQWRRLLSAT